MDQVKEWITADYVGVSLNKMVIFGIVGILEMRSFQKSKSLANPIRITHRFLG